MNFVFSRRYLFLLAIGTLPLLLSWFWPSLRPAAFAFDLLLFAAALVDLMLSRKLPDEFRVTRTFDQRFAIGAETKVSVTVTNSTSRGYRIRIKDEYPAAIAVTDGREAEFYVAPHGEAVFYYHLKPARRGKYDFGTTAVRHLSKWGLVWSTSTQGTPQSVKVYPNLRRSREMELKALGARSFLAIQRRAVRRGEGREFESMRDYVRGDELRHISWTATARRSKLTTRQYQIERDQTVMIAVDAGRLMTGIIDGETKFDTAVHAMLALMSACARAGDNCGILVFGRRVRRYLPPKRGFEHFDAVLEALYDVEPEMIEPSYARAFQHMASNLKKRAFIVVLTDLVDQESSKDLLRSLKLLRPRHLPLVATVGDTDLISAISRVPGDINDVFSQSAAQEIIRQRESALRMVESAGGLALDVTTKTLALKLLENYLHVKERAML